MTHPNYNKKAFLLPDSIHSSAIYHAKIMPDGLYYFRVSDCHNAIRLHGDLNDSQQRIEAIEKLKALSEAAKEFSIFIEENYTN